MFAIETGFSVSSGSPYSSLLDIKSWSNYRLCECDLVLLKWDENLIFLLRHSVNLIMLNRKELGVDGCAHTLLVHLVARELHANYSDQAVSISSDEDPLFPFIANTTYFFLYTLPERPTFGILSKETLCFRRAEQIEATATASLFRVECACYLVPKYLDMSPYKKKRSLRVLYEHYSIINPTFYELGCLWLTISHLLGTIATNLDFNSAY